MYDKYKYISNKDILTPQLVSSKKNVNMEKPVESDQKENFQEEEQDLCQGLFQLQSDLLTLSGLIHFMK